MRPELLQNLREYEEQAKEIARNKRGGWKKGSLESMEAALDCLGNWHQYGGNKGINWGISIQPGHLTIQRSAEYYKKYPELAKKIHDVLQQILDEFFGNLLWYKRMKAYCKRLNEQMGQERVVDDCVFSGAWLTLVTKEASIHRDHNVVGAAFLLSTYEPEGLEACLTVKSDKAKHPENIPMIPGTVLGGGWAQQEHCNSNVSAKTVSNRTSWVLYLDKRVFGANYIGNF